MDRDILGTEVTLPSKGLLYDGKIPNGVVRVVPMTTREEKRILGTSPQEALQAIDDVLNKCVSALGDFPANNLIIGDRFYLVNVLRAISYGSTYAFAVTCDFCNQRFPKAVNLLEDLPIIFLKEDAKEPFSCHLPSINVDVKLRLLRGKDEQEIIKYTDNIYAKATVPVVGDPAYSYRMAKHIVEVATPDGKKIENNSKDTMLKLVDFYDSLLTSDTMVIKETLADYDCGPDTELALECPRCRGSFVTAMPYRGEFFRPSGRRRA
jgi:hypothetical protein